MTARPHVMVVMGQSQGVRKRRDWSEGPGISRVSGAQEWLPKPSDNFAEGGHPCAGEGLEDAPIAGCTHTAGPTLGQVYYRSHTAHQERSLDDPWEATECMSTLSSLAQNRKART